MSWRHTDSVLALTFFFLSISMRPYQNSTQIVLRSLIMIIPFDTTNLSPVIKYRTYTMLSEMLLFVASAA